MARVYIAPEAVRFGLPDENDPPPTPMTRNPILWRAALALALLVPPAAMAETIAILADRAYPSPEAPPVIGAVAVITDGRIAAFGTKSEVRIPAGARVVQANGQTLLAGFWNSHVHLIEPRFQNARSMPADQLSRHLRDMLVRRGFVHVFEIAAFDLQNTLAMRARIESGEVKGPSIRTTGVPFVPPKGVPAYLPENSLPEFGDPQEARAFVARQLDAGADGAKFWSVSPTRAGPVGMPADVARAAVEAAHAKGKPVFAHPTNMDGVRLALEAGVDVLAHASPEGAFDDALIARLKARGVALVPTLKLFRWDPQRQGAPPEVIKRLIAAAEEQLRAFSRAGVTILFGTDVGYVTEDDTAEEFASMARAGMDFRQVLASLTTAPARKFGAADRTGRLARGMDADLVLVDGDPATDIGALGRVRQVMRRGTVLFEAPGSAAGEVAKHEREAAFWQAVFDPAAPQPAAEGELFSMVKSASGAMLPEVRDQPLRLEGVRIIYGTPMVSYVGHTESSARVAERVNAALRARFGGEAPITIDREGRAGKAEQIEQSGRTGFGFAIRRGRELEERLPKGVRFRERELMEALAIAIRDLDLEPVIVWSRGSVYIFNLWQRAG